MPRSTNRLSRNTNTLRSRTRVRVRQMSAARWWSDRWGTTTRSFGVYVIALAGVTLAGCANGNLERSERTQPQSSEVTWECPDNYQVKAGLNTDFPHQGMKR